MKLHATIVLIFVCASSCTKGGSSSSAGDSIPETGIPSGPVPHGSESGSSEPGSSNAEGLGPNTGPMPTQDQTPIDPAMPGQGTGTQTSTGSGNQAPVEFGVLNFRQYTATLSSMTGVALNAPAAAGGIAPHAEYARASSGLPRSNRLSNFSFAHASSMLRLSSAYCDVLANTVTLLEAKFPNLSLTDLPADTTAYAQTLLAGFYGPETSLQGPRLTHIADVAATVDYLKTLPEATGPAIFMATCAALLSSGEIVIY